MSTWEVLFCLVSKAFDDFVSVPPWSACLAPNGCSEKDAFKVEFVLYDMCVLGKLGVCVVLDGVSLSAFRLGGDARVDCNPSAVEDCVDDMMSPGRSR